MCNKSRSVTTPALHDRNCKRGDRRPSMKGIGPYACTVDRGVWSRLAELPPFQKTLVKTYHVPSKSHRGQGENKRATYIASLWATHVCKTSVKCKFITCCYTHIYIIETREPTTTRRIFPSLAFSLETIRSFAISDLISHCFKRRITYA